MKLVKALLLAALALLPVTTAIALPVWPVTQTASGVSNYQATLRGALVMNGRPTRVGFEYRAVGARHWKRTPWQRLASGTVAVPFSTVIENLTPDTDYQFRAAAIVSGVKRYARPEILQTFHTAGLKQTPDVQIISVDPLGATEVLIIASVTPNAADVSVHLDYGANTQYGSDLIVTNFAGIREPQQFKFIWSSLAPATLYHFRLRATGEAGTTATEDHSLITLGGAPVIGSTVASNVTATAASLRATVNPNSVDTVVFFEWGMTTNYDHRSSGIHATGTNSVAIQNVVSNLATATLHHFRVIASNSIGVVESADTEFTTPCLPNNVMVTVSDMTESALRAALATGNNIVFMSDGAITLTSPIKVNCTLSIDANGHTVSLNGSGATRLIEVRNGAELTLRGLQLSQGVVIGSNSISGRGESVQGGAVLVEGSTFTALNCVFSDNVIFAGNGGLSETEAIGGDARGGAISAISSTLSISGCTFLNNNAVSGSEGVRPITALPGLPGSAMGGALATSNCTVFFINCFLSANGAKLSSQMPNAPYGMGGGLFFEGGSVTVVQGYFTNNFASGSGAAIYSLHSTMSVASSMFGANIANSSGDAIGGAITIDNGTMALTESSFVENEAVAGAASATPTQNNGGTGAGGGVAVKNGGDASIARCTFTMNEAVGGNGTGLIGLTSDFLSSGNGIGGAVYSEATLTIENCTFFDNSVDSGFVPGETIADLGAGYGGAIGIAGGASKISFSTIANNSAFCGSGHTNLAEGGGIFVGTGTLSLTHTILSTNWSNFTIRNNLSGIVNDQGNNISSDATPIFSLASSRNNLDPLLDVFGDWGGPTQTIRLQPNSPAIDAGDDSVAPWTDQRNFQRPQGTAVDIGSYEQ